MRYLQEVRVSTFPPSPQLPEGVRHSRCLVDLESGAVVLLYDVHRGKSHYGDPRSRETSYNFVAGNTLLDDFLRDVELILEGKL